MSLNGHAQGGQEPLGRVEIHHDPLIGFDVLTTGRKRLRIQAEVENDFLGGGGDPAEIRVRRQGRGIVDDDLGLLLRLGILGGSGALLCSLSLISGSEVLRESRTPGKYGDPKRRVWRRRRSRFSCEAPFQRIIAGNASRWPVNEFQRSRGDRAFAVRL